MYFPGSSLTSFQLVLRYNFEGIGADLMLKYTAITRAYESSRTHLCEKLEHIFITVIWLVVATIVPSRTHNF